MSTKSAQDIVDHLKSNEWQNEKQAMILYFGHIPSLREMREKSKEMGMTFAEFRKEIIEG